MIESSELNRQKSSELDMRPVSFYLDPISKKIMNEPVILNDGITYEKESIEDYILNLPEGEAKSKGKNDVVLDLRKMIPNDAIKNIIQDFLEKNPQYKPYQYEKNTTLDDVQALLDKNQYAVLLGYISTHKEQIKSLSQRKVFDLLTLVYSRVKFAERLFHNLLEVLGVNATNFILTFKSQKLTCFQAAVRHASFATITLLIQILDKKAADQILNNNTFIIALTFREVEILKLLLVHTGEEGKNALTKIPDLPRVIHANPYFNNLIVFLVNFIPDYSAQMIKSLIAHKYSLNSYSTPGTETSINENQSPNQLSKRSHDNALAKPSNPPTSSRRISIQTLVEQNNSDNNFTSYPFFNSPQLANINNSNISNIPSVSFSNIQLWTHPAMIDLSDNEVERSNQESSKKTRGSTSIQPTMQQTTHVYPSTKL